LKKSEPKKAAISEARQRLAGMIEARDAIIPKLRALEAQRDRLAALEKPDNLAASELAQLTAKESAALAAWSVSGEGPMPTTNVFRRLALEKRVAASNATVANARLASVGVLAEIESESRRYASMDAPIQVAIVEVLIDEVEPQIRSFESMNEELSARVMQIQQLGKMITEKAHAVSDIEVKGSLFAFNTRFFERLEKVNTRKEPMEDIANAQRAKWSALWTALSRDANAQFSPGAANEPESVADIAAIVAARNAVLASFARKGL
jgi:hypothetical protein